jgi:tetratricopeptide (TPR) repeat protein
MIWVSRVALFVLIGFLSGCASYQIAGQVESGRRALLVNDPERALPYLLEAANNDPNYVYSYDLFRESVWTYLGRSQYATKKYSEARQSFERALALDKDDHLARLYLGLTLTRLGDSAQGVKEIEAGMQGIHDWLEYRESARPFEAYWDPGRVIRKTVEKDLAGDAGRREVGRDQLITDAEWMGKRLEEEVEYVRRDRRRPLEHDFDGRHGMSIGIGVGF